MSTSVLAARAQRINVLDGYEDHPDRKAWDEEIGAWEAYLRAHPEEVVDDQHPARQWFHSTPISSAWSELMPTAAALYPLQYPEVSAVNGVAVDAGGRAFFRHLDDARGIRTRATVMSDLVKAHFSTAALPLAWTSLACGAAVPIHNALVGLGKPHVQVSLVDMDSQALDHAEEIFRGPQVPSSTRVNTLQRNLIRTLCVGTSLVEEIGAHSQDMVDMLGIFEYFRTEYAVALLRNALNLVAPGGMLVLANMLDTHPQLHINQRVIQWPKIYPRSLDQIEDILIQAGVNLDHVQVLLPKDGVYAVVAIFVPPAQD